MPDISKMSVKWLRGDGRAVFKFTVLAEFILGQCFKSCKDKKGTDLSLCLCLEELLNRLRRGQFFESGWLTFNNARWLVRPNHLEQLKA